MRGFVQGALLALAIGWVAPDVDAAHRFLAFVAIFLVIKLESRWQ